MRRLRLLMDIERDQIEAELRRRLKEFEEVQREHRAIEDRMQMDITSLSDRLESLLTVPPTLLDPMAKQR